VNVSVNFYMQTFHIIYMLQRLMIFLSYNSPTQFLKIDFAGAAVLIHSGYSLVWTVALIARTALKTPDERKLRPYP